MVRFQVTDIVKVVRDFLMQCFQKDPNLRVSARKLLKHPWIVNAKRSDAVVPKKPTEYDEAVKSVQQWNEALRSPDAGSLRRTSRPMSSSPIPGRREPTTPVRAPLHHSKPRFSTDQFRSPRNTSEDNWDDDFASAISPNALQLPHLRPHDNFGGLLSSEKLKAFASFETVTEESNWDDNFEGDLTMKSPSRSRESDPLETIRPTNMSRANTRPNARSSPGKPLEYTRMPATARSAVATLASYSASSPAKPQNVVPRTQKHGEALQDEFSKLMLSGSDYENSIIKHKVRRT